MASHMPAPDGHSDMDGAHEAADRPAPQGSGLARACTAQSHGHGAALSDHDGGPADPRIPFSPSKTRHVPYRSSSPRAPRSPHHTSRQTCYHAEDLSDHYSAQLTTYIGTMHVTSLRRTSRFRSESPPSNIALLLRRTLSRGRRESMQRSRRQTGTTMSEEVVSPLRVLIVDDDPRILTVFAKELDAQLTISVCATAAGGEHALDTPSWRSHHIDVILLDISMPGLNGIQTARAIHRNLPDLPIVMFTAFSDERTLSEALTEGVKGFITKDESVEGVATALIRAKKGMSTMSAHPIELLVSAYQSEQRRQRNAAQEQRKIMNLPPRLRNVHDFILKDLTNRQIARRSGISENTTRIYVSDLLHRLGYASREELMAASLLEAPKVPHTEKPICNITEAAES